MAVFNWDKWVAASPHPEIAQTVLEWLVAGNYDEPVWQARDALVNLLATDRSRQAPGHTDLMVAPESIDAFMEANPLLPETDGA